MIARDRRAAVGGPVVIRHMQPQSRRIGVARRHIHRPGKVCKRM